MKKFYDLRAFIDKFPKAKYYLFYGLRSNGKTHGALDVSHKDQKVYL